MKRMNLEGWNLLSQSSCYHNSTFLSFVLL